MTDYEWFSSAHYQFLHSPEVATLRAHYERNGFPYFEKTYDKRKKICLFYDSVSTRPSAEYTPEQIAAMSPSSISKVVEDYKKAKRALHVLKAKKYFHAETKLMNALFPNQNIGSKDFDWYLDLPKNVTLRSLGIGTKQVIDEFISRKLLPKNFYSLSPENVSMP